MEILNHTRIYILSICCLILNFSNGIGISHFPHPPQTNNYGLNMHKIALTQVGYIQFLRYITEIPSLADFTFCIWIHSSNLTHSHPLLSYSEHEETRYIRAWISPFGREINLALREVPVLRVPVNLRENQWYHICQSWSSISGNAALYLNGKLIHMEQNEKLQGLILPPHGDLVVGQEYTDFDKGLEDGIEGLIFGFNMVLESATDVSQNINHYKSKYPTNFRPLPSSIKNTFFYNDNINKFPFPPLFDNMNYLRRNYHNDDTRYLSYPENRVRLVLRRHVRNAENYKDETKSTRSKRITNEATKIKPHLEVRGENFPKYIPTQETPKMLPKAELIETENVTRINRHVNNELRFGYFQKRIKPKGLQLVELGYGHCFLGRGAPLSGPSVLISWTKTNVRVFGGAIIKPAQPVCGNF